MTGPNISTNVNPDPSTGTGSFPKNTSQVPTTPGVLEKESDSRVDQVANRLAHKGAKAEQAFDKENEPLFNK